MYGFSWMIVKLLLIIGALNWGLDAFHYNLFTIKPFSSMPRVVWVVKILVGLAGLISLLFFVKKLM